MNPRLRRAAKATIGATLALFVAGCGSIGPEALPRDRIDYAGAIGDSWKQQTLLNIIKLRYGDFPVFLDVQQVIAGYQFNSTVNGGVNASSTSFEGPTPSFMTLGGSILLQGSYTDSPTVLYVPTTGSDFLTRLMTPIPPSTVLFLIQSGYAADRVLQLTLDSINGVRNELRRAAFRRPADPAFLRLGELLRQRQATGEIETRIVKPKDGPETSMLIFDPLGRTPESDAARQEIARILGLGPDAHEVNVFYGGYSGSGNEIAMMTRSMLQIMIEIGAVAEVPAADVADGRAVGFAPVDPAAGGTGPLVSIASGDTRPDDSYVAVPYNGRWFWIADTDIQSKYMFSFIMLLFAISDTGVRGSAPVVTVPAH